MSDYLSLAPWAFLVLVVFFLVKLVYGNLNTITGIDDLAQVDKKVTNHKKFGHAIVCGGSIAGMLCARVLLNHFEKVTIIDPDAIKDLQLNSKYVPQQQYSHVIRGFFTNFVEKMFTTFEDFLQKRKVRWAAFSSFRTFQWGRWSNLPSGNLKALLATRLVVEEGIRRDLYSQYEGRLVILEKTSVSGLIPGGKLVKGVYIKTDEDLSPREILGDLVVDATGAACKGSKWLPELGYAAPPVDTYNPFVTYCSRYYENNGALDDKNLMVYAIPTPPYGRKGCLLSEVEDNKILVTLGGINKVVPDSENFEEWLTQIEVPWVYNKIKPLTPVSKPKSFKIGPCRINYYNKIETPANFVAVGDSYAKFNPIYAQGLSCAALSVVTLDSVLRRVKSGDFVAEKLASKYNNRVQRRYFIQWAIPKGSDDYLYTDTPEQLSWYERFLRSYSLLQSEAGSFSPEIQYKAQAVLSIISNPLDMFDLTCFVATAKLAIKKALKFNKK